MRDIIVTSTLAMMIPLSSLCFQSVSHIHLVCSDFASLYRAMGVFAARSYWILVGHRCKNLMLLAVVRAFQMNPRVVYEESVVVTSCDDDTLELFVFSVDKSHLLGLF